MPLTFSEKRYIIAWPRSGIRRSNSAAIDRDRLYESRLHVRFPFPPTRKRSFFQRDLLPETKLGFRIKMCVENVLDFVSKCASIQERRTFDYPEA